MTKDSADYTQTIIDLYLRAVKILLDLPKSERRDIDDIEVVFVDVINGNIVPHRAVSFQDVLQSIADKGKPVGLIFDFWGEPEKMQVKGFPNLTIPEELALTASFVEAQDESKECNPDED